MLPALAHDVQLVAEPRHVWHVALQLVQTPALSVSGFRYKPIAHGIVHVPWPALKVAPATHDVHAEKPESEHVAQDASHAWHALLASGYLPLGHALTHAPSS